VLEDADHTELRIYDAALRISDAIYEPFQDRREPANIIAQRRNLVGQSPQRAADIGEIDIVRFFRHWGLLSQPRD
jgi:hypothetical protein